MIERVAYRVGRVIAWVTGRLDRMVGRFWAGVGRFSTDVAEGFRRAGL
jgi:hypothetical protein